MAGLTNSILTQIANKRLAGKAMVSGKLNIIQEEFGSFIQQTNTTIFGSSLPNNPSQTEWLIQSASGANTGEGSVVWVEFDLVTIGSAYANSSGTDNQTGAEQEVFDHDLGDTSTYNTNTFHAYALKLPSDFQTQLSSQFDSNTATGISLGNERFTANYIATGSNKFQIVPEFVSTIKGTNNPYLPQVKDHTGATIAANNDIAYYLDAASGILFVQNPPDTALASTADNPQKVRAFLYVGKYQDEIQGDTVSLHFNASEGTDFSIANNATASFVTGSGDGLIISASGTNTLTFKLNNVASGSSLFHVSASTGGGFSVGSNATASFESGSAGITVNAAPGSNKITIGSSTDNVHFNGGRFDNDVRVQGNIIAENYIVSSSITYMTQSFSSGSTIFGDTNDDTHLFTGSLSILHTGSGYGFQMSGSNFLVDHGDFGKVTLGIDLVGNETFAPLLPITGAGLIINQNFTNEATHHNMVKIGQTELVDISGSVTTDTFLLNLRDKRFLIVSSSNLSKPIAEFAHGDISLYGNIVNGTAVKLFETDNNDNVFIGDGSSPNVQITANLLSLAGNNTRIRADLMTPTASSAVVYISNTPPTGSGAHTSETNNMKTTPLSSLLTHLGGAVTASAVSSSGNLYANLNASAGATDFVAMYDTSSGLFYYTASEAIGGSGFFISASDGTGGRIAADATASFSASGAGLTASFSNNNVTYNITPNTVIEAVNTATVINITASYANTASFITGSDVVGIVSSASFATTASYVESASYALTASYLEGGSATVKVTEDNATNNLQTVIFSNLQDDIAGGSDINNDVALKTANFLSVDAGNKHLYVSGASNYTRIEPNAIQTDASTYNILTTGTPDTINMGVSTGIVSFKGSASIDGDLIVNGTTTTLNTQNLLVEDKYILIHSGSSALGGGNAGGGIIVERTAQNVGTALHWDEGSEVWGIDLSDADASSATAKDTDVILVTVQHTTGVTAAPSGAPLMGFSDQYKYGQMYIQDGVTDDGNGIWIYAP